MFGLFKKNVEQPAGCICVPSESPIQASPFEETQRLTGPYTHENVALARCKKCCKPALHYSADVYDDFWQYWCLIDDAERELLIAPDEGEDEPQLPVRAREILARHPSLEKGPVRGYEWAPAGAGVVEGPPW